MIKLDHEEQALLNSIEKGEWQSKPNLEQRKKELQRYAQHQLNSKKHFDITLSVNDFERLKSFASTQGLDYHVVAENILHHYLNSV